MKGIDIMGVVVAVSAVEKRRAMALRKAMRDNEV
jgi:hypothetical protein